MKPEACLAMRLMRAGGVVGAMLGRITAYASGAMVRAQGMLSGIGDHVTPILAEDGELVLSVKAVRQLVDDWGAGVVGALLQGRLPGFAQGGLVSLASWSPRLDLPRFDVGGPVGSAPTAASKAAPHLGTVDLRTDAGTYRVMATPDVAAELCRAAEREKLVRRRK